MNSSYALRNNVFLMNFPNKLKVQGDVGLYYNLIYRKLPLNEYILCRAQGIVVYSKDGQFDVQGLNFFSKVYTVTDKFIDVFEEHPTESLDKLVGRERLVNPRQFEIIKGSVVRSVIDAKLGAGVVQKVEDNMIQVNFPKAKGYYSNPVIKCHKSNLRVVAHIEEVSHGS